MEIERNVGNFAYPETHTHDAGVGLTEKTIHYISDIKEDPIGSANFASTPTRLS